MAQPILTLPRDGFPPLCLPSADWKVAYVQAFAELVEVWLELDDDNTLLVLAAILGMTRKRTRLSEWRYGTGGRYPPFWVLMALCYLTGHQLVFDPAGAVYVTVPPGCSEGVA